MHRLTLLALTALTFALPRTAVAASDLVVDVEDPDGDTGTMHYAAALTLTAPCAPPRRLEGSAGEDGALLPLPGPSFRLPGARYLLLGWSSGGGGMQSVHALLLACGHGALQLQDRLDLVTDRPHAGLLLHPEADGSVSLGLPSPPDEAVHEPTEWSLSHTGGTTVVTLEGMRRLAYAALPPAPADVFYAPTGQIAPRPQRVAWIRVGSDGFVLPVASRAP